MIISRTPFRMSFLGGGTDYPAWYRSHGGLVLATTIDKYCYLTMRRLPPFFEHRYRVVYSKMENCETLDEIQHPSARESLRFLDIRHGLEIHHDADLPARSGIGSSSAFTVGMLNGLHAMRGRMVSKQQLMTEAIHIEQNVLREAVGSQDQALAAHGGFNTIQFLPNGEIVVNPMILPAERVAELNASLMLFFTGIKRTANDVAGEFARNLEPNRRQMRIMTDLAQEGISVLSGHQDLSTFGQLLHEAWVAKQKMSANVSNEAVDGIYEEALAAGAIGGKLLGAGGGGFVLLFAPPDRQAAVRGRLERLIHVPFRFESTGSRIIYFDRDCEYTEEERVRDNGRILPFRELTEKPNYV